MARKLLRRIKIYVEGHTEERYFNDLSDDYELDLLPEVVNMKGGGYTSFLKHLKQNSDTGYVAVFIIIDLDRYKTIDGEKKCFDTLLEYIKGKNKIGSVPYFLIVNNDDFELFLCLHCPDYKFEDTDKYICDNFKYGTIKELKKDQEIYSYVNNDNLSLKNAGTQLETIKKFLTNEYNIDKDSMEFTIVITDTVTEVEELDNLNTNMNEFIEVVLN